MKPSRALVACLASAAALAIVAAAPTQGPPPGVPGRTPRLVDARGTQVGALAGVTPFHGSGSGGEATAVLFYDDLPVEVIVSSGGVGIPTPTGPVWAYFASSNCTGTPYQTESASATDFAPFEAPGWLFGDTDTAAFFHAPLSGYQSMTMGSALLRSGFGTCESLPSVNRGISASVVVAPLIRDVLPTFVPPIRFVQ